MKFSLSSNSKKMLTVLCLFFFAAISALCYFYFTKQKILIGLPDKKNKVVLTNSFNSKTIQVCLQLILSFDEVREILKNIKPTKKELIHDLKQMIKKNQTIDINEDFVNKYVKLFNLENLISSRVSNNLEFFVYCFFNLYDLLDSEIIQSDYYQQIIKDKKSPLSKLFETCFDIFIKYNENVTKGIKLSGSEKGNQRLFLLSNSSIGIVAERLLSLQNVTEFINKISDTWILSYAPTYIFAYIENNSKLLGQIFSKKNDLSNAFKIEDKSYTIVNLIFIDETEMNLDFLTIRENKFIHINNNVYEYITRKSFDDFILRKGLNNVVVVLKKKP